MRAVLVGSALVSLCGTAAAQIRDEDAHDAVESAHTRYSLVAGAGLEGFIDSHLREAVSSGPAWNVRGSIGNPEEVSVEVFYAGSRQPMKMGADTLVGNGVLGQVRINLFPAAFLERFFYFGAGWSRFSVKGRTADSMFPAHDDVLEMPIGVGLAYRTGAFVADLRAGFTVVTGQDLIANPDALGSEHSYSMHRFGISAQIGYSL
jgi:hypothetical protein